MARPPRSSAAVTGGSQTGRLPSFERLLHRLRARLDEAGEVGLVSVSVLQLRGVEHSAGWGAYEAMVRAVTAYLDTFLKQAMRHDDWLFETGLSGNSFVLVLGPPRHGRAIDPADLAKVRARIKRGLRNHLASCLPAEVLASFGSYVGSAVLRPAPRVRFERNVHRTLEQAFADSLRDKNREGRRLAGHLQRVLDSGLVHSVYQPVVDIVERRVLGYEALTRVGGNRFRSVETLFKAAEEHDALWSLERLCRRKAIEGLPPLGPDHLLFLNVEAESMQDPHLRHADFLDRLESVGLSPKRIVLELTEHSIVKDFAAFRRTLAEFREIGFRLAMDDVGSGYSGLRAIAEIGPDFIKADMTLVRRLHENALKRELIDTIRRFSDSTGITLVAEGVECVEELEALDRLGVRCAQGYLFARPDRPPGIPDWERIYSRRDTE